MKTFMFVSNNKSTPITLYIEPWAHDYTLMPQEQYEIRFHSRQVPMLVTGVVINDTNDIQVYIENVFGVTDLRISVYMKGELLEMGHNRPLC